MSATVSLVSFYKFGSWVVSRTEVGLNDDTARVHLKPAGRRTGFRCPKRKRRMGKMREQQQQVLDLPLGMFSVAHLVFTAYQSGTSES